MNKNNKYDDLDYCVNLLYDSIYNRQKSKDCYQFGNVDKNNIKINMIKKPNNFNYDNIIKNAKYSYINFIDDTVLFKRHSTSHATLVKFGLYDDDNMGKPQ